MAPTLALTLVFAFLTPAPPAPAEECASECALKYKANADRAEELLELAAIRLEGKDREIRLLEVVVTAQKDTIATRPVVVRSVVPTWAWVTIGALAAAAVVGGVGWAIEAKR